LKSQNAGPLLLGGQRRQYSQQYSHSLDIDDEEAQRAKQEEYYNDLMCITGRATATAPVASIPRIPSIPTSSSFDDDCIHDSSRLPHNQHQQQRPGSTNSNSPIGSAMTTIPHNYSITTATSDAEGSAVSRSSLLSHSNNTVVAGNRTMSSSSLLLSSVVCLSVLKSSQELSNKNGNATPQLVFLPPSTKTVRESLDRHLKFHLSRHAYLQQLQQEFEQKQHQQHQHHHHHSNNNSINKDGYQPYQRQPKYHHESSQHQYQIMSSSSTFDTIDSKKSAVVSRSGGSTLVATFPKDNAVPCIQQQYSGINSTKSMAMIPTGPEGHPVLQISLSDSSLDTILNSTGSNVQAASGSGMHGVGDSSSNSHHRRGSSGDGSSSGQHVHQAALEFLQEGNVAAALAIYQGYLEKQTKQSSLYSQRQHYVGKNGKNEDVLMSMPAMNTFFDAHRADTLSKLAVLCLHAGRNKQAMQYSFEALRLHRQESSPTSSSSFPEGNGNGGGGGEASDLDTSFNSSMTAITTWSRPLQAAIATMEVGLIHLATSRAGRSLKSWREAMQMCCVTVGYEHPIVAILLNNIGVLHYEAGDALSSTRALEESLELQRNLLRTGMADGSGGTCCASATHVDYALYQMATTVGNLAMACELREQYDRSTSLLQESLTFYDSIVQADTSLHVQIVQENLERLSKLLRKRARLAQAGGGRCPVEKSLLTSLEESSATMEDSSTGGNGTDDENNTSGGDDDSCAERFVHMFGNSDGIPRTAGAAWKQVTMELSDIHDYLLLGPISHELTPRQRVREAVLAWFGRPLDDNVLGFGTPFVAYDDHPSTTNSSSPTGRRGPGGRRGIPIDIDDDSVVDADLCLRAINQQAMEHLDHHEIGDALDLFQSALHSHVEKYGADHHLVGCTLHNIGLVHLFAEEYLQAYGVFKEAARIRSKALGPYHPDVAATLMKIGMLQYAAMDISAAARTFSQIREVYLKTMGYGHPQLAKVMNNMGTIRYEQGDMTAAHRAFEISYEYQRRLMEENPGNCAVAEMAMAYTLSNIGFLYQRQGDLLGALRLFEAAKVALSRHVGTTPSNNVKFAMIQNNIELLMGKGVEIEHCEEACTMNAQPCMVRLPWNR
jgi:tetratricopeptide (TPR) repeat protein